MIRFIQITLAAVVVGVVLVSFRYFDLESAVALGVMLALWGLAVCCLALIVLVSQRIVGKPVMEGWFDFSGRRNRLSYFMSLVMLIIVSWMALLFLPLLGIPIAHWIIRIHVILIVVATLVSLFIMTAQRIRDFGWAGGPWSIVFLVISPILGGIVNEFTPVVIFVLALITLFVVPGTKGKNKYGPDPLQQQG